jgi:hypothetical protein
MGGGGVWKYLKAHGDKIAAAVPICGTKKISSTDASTSSVKNTPIWAFHNYGDDVVNVSSTEQIVSWIKAANPVGDIRKTIYAWSGHNSWDVTYSGEGRDTTSNSSNQIEYGASTNKPDIFKWMFTHNLRAPYPLRVTVFDEDPDKLIIEFNQPVTQASTDGLYLEGTDAKLASLLSGLGTTQLIFNLSRKIEVGEILSLYYDDRIGILSNSLGSTTEFEDFEVDNQVGFMRLDSNDVAIDFSDSSQSSVVEWNQLTDIQKGIVLGNLKKISGEQTSINIEKLTSWSGAFSDGTITGDNSGVFPDQVMETFWTVGSDEEQLSVKGLDTDKIYNFYFFSSRASSKNVRVTEFSIQDKITTLDANMNTNRVAKITDILPDTSGRVEVKMRRPENSQYGYINALVIRAIDSASEEPANQLPVITANSDTTVKLPVEQVVLTSEADDPDGEVTAYEWVQKTGPNECHMTGADSEVLVVTGVTQGEYFFEISATDDKGAISSKEVKLAVEGQNEAPFVTTASEYSIILPLDSVTLTGSAIDSDGYVESYQWIQKSGPSEAMIESGSAAETWIKKLNSGIYTFTLEATDNEGGKSSSDVIVQVSENQSPTVDAGEDIVIVLPENSVNLTANATDIDGQIVGFIWSQVFGPTIAQIDDIHSQEPTIGQLTSGVYIFEVKVVDDLNATNTDSVSVEVIKESSNTPPGEEQYLTGLTYSYYEGNWDQLPNFAGLEAVKTGEVVNFSLSPRETDSYFAFTFDGYIDISTEGQYTFYTASDDGSKLYIDQQEVVNNDGRHGKVERSGQVYLTEGKHAIRVTYFEKWGGEILEVKYAGPDLAKQFIPSQMLSHADDTGNQRYISSLKSGSSEFASEKIIKNENTSIQTFPNPVQDVLHISLDKERSVKVIFLDNFGNAIHTAETINDQFISIDLRSLDIALGGFVLTVIDTENNQFLFSKQMLRVQ